MDKKNKKLPAAVDKEEVCHKEEQEVNTYSK